MAVVANVERVRDRADPRLADYANLTDVRLRRALEPAGGLFVAEGETVIRRALSAGYQPRSVLLSERWLPSLADVLDPLGVTVLLADHELLRSVTGYAVHRGALASMQRRPLPATESVVAAADHLVVLEGLVDPTNVGAVFRVAAALGFDGVLLDPTCADPLYRRAVRVSMGAVLAVPYARVTAWPAGLRSLRSAGLTVLALTPDPDAVPLDALPGGATTRCALLLGTEGDGLSPAALDAADLRVRIPMSRGVDSLNVGAAAAVACWAVTHSAGGDVPDRAVPPT
jgi:tRNA G18 (ribose-2'-O)-methylase SpoU